VHLCLSGLTVFCHKDSKERREKRNLQITF
jgi:hypothetical protein